MASADLAEFLASAEEVARAAGKMIREAHEQRSSGLAIESKGSEATQTVDLVTQTDKACEDHILGTLKARYPDHAFIGEESSFTGPGATAPSGPLELTDAPTWIVDPLDGTTNFVHGYPRVTVSIGLAVKKELVVGVIYNPIMEELCSAVRGGGAHLNGRRVHVGSASAVTDALICNNIGASRAPEVNALSCARLLALLQANSRGLRNSGSAAQNMMHVACGRLDAYFEDGFGGPWDVAAGAVIVKEAGGVCSDHLGGPFVLKAGKGQVLCGNSAVVQDVARVLRGVPG
jgi:inositol-phosphate phosphatase/L-galactose 1-phosphate phosphatase